MEKSDQRVKVRWKCEAALVKSLLALRNLSKDAIHSVRGKPVACRRDFSLTPNRIQTHRRSALRPGSILTASPHVAGGSIGSQIVGGITLQRTRGSSCLCHTQKREDVGLSDTELQVLGGCLRGLWPV